jgi:hypothetical protein
MNESMLSGNKLLETDKQTKGRRMNEKIMQKYP